MKTHTDLLFFLYFLIARTAGVGASMSGKHGDDAAAITEDNDEPHPFLRQLGPPSCDDTKCRWDCEASGCPAESYVCTSCGGGGGGGDPPSTCSGEGESCSDGCCDGLSCITFGKGRNKISFCTRYVGNSDNRNGPIPTTANTDMKFLTFGDTPYDESAGPPFVGSDYACVQDTILPEAKSLSTNGTVDWIVHVVDIKKGSDANSAFCNDEVFTTRYSLFTAVEPELDFLLLAGDNEFSGECDGWTPDAIDGDIDPVQSLWRSYFTNNEFAGLDKTTPVWGTPVFQRQEGYPENFFMYYAELNLVIFGITEPAADNAYNIINADFIQTELSHLGANPADAIIIFGHAAVETSGNLDHVFDVLDGYSNIPMLYVMGNDHKYKMDFYAPSRLPKLMQLTVEAFKSAPLLVSVVDVEGDNYFYVEKISASC